MVMKPEKKSVPEGHALAFDRLEASEEGTDNSNVHSAKSLRDLPLDVRKRMALQTLYLDRYE